MEKEILEIYIKCLKLNAENASNTIDKNEILSKIEELQKEAADA